MLGLSSDRPQRSSVLAHAILAALGFAGICSAQGYNIYTVAGDGVLGYSGDNGSAVKAELWAFSGLAVDSHGNIFIADTGNCRIRKVSVGVISTAAGNGICAYGGDGGAATAAQLSFPRGVAVDAAGNIYIADGGNARVRKVDTHGIITTIAGNGTLGFSGDGGPANQSLVWDPWSIATDPAGNVYFVDRTNQRVRRIGTDGNINTVAGNGIAADTGDGGQATAASLYIPVGVNLDSAGNMYIVDSQSDSIRKVTTNGIIQTIAGTGTLGYSGDGGPAINAMLDDPQGVAVDAAGNVFIADEDNQRLREVTTDGNINTVAGNGTKAFSGDGGNAANSALDLPEGVAAGLNGQIYFVDSGNKRIRLLTPIGLVSGCDINADSTTNVADVQLIINQALGVAPATNDLNHDGMVNVADIQIVINAALGLGCSAS